MAGSNGGGGFMAWDSGEETQSFFCFLGTKEGANLFAPFHQAPSSASRTGTASRAPVGRASHKVFERWASKLTVLVEALLPSRAARKLVYVSSMKVFDRQEKLMARLCLHAPKL